MAVRFLSLLLVLFISGCSNDNGTTQPPVVNPPQIPTADLPIADAGHSMQLRQGATAVLNGSGSYDPNGAKLTYQWSIVSAPAGSTSALSDSTSVFPSIYLDVVGDYQFELVVNNGTDDSKPSTVTISDSDSVPVANAGYDRQFSGTQSITLDGSRSFDSDGDALTFRWSITSSPSGSSAALARDNTPFAVLTPDVAGQYEIELIVNDGKVDSAPDTVIVTDQNLAPIANAGLDTTFSVGMPVVLDGSGSFDGDGDALTYQWQLVTQPSGSTASLVGDTTLHPQLTPDAAGDYVISLVVNDGISDSGVDTVTLRNADHIPVADAGRNLSVATGSRVQIDGTGSYDADGDSLTPRWSITSKPANSLAQLSDTATFHPYFIADVDGDYVVQLIAYDGSHLSTPSIARISSSAGGASNSSNLRPIAHAGSAQSVSIGQVVHLDGSGSYDPEGAAITYQWSILSAPAGSTASLSSTTIASPDITPDVAGSFLLQLVVSDGSQSSTPSTVLITDVNLPPVAKAGNDQSVATGATVTLNGATSSDPEGGTLTYSWSFISKPISSTAALANSSAASTTFNADVTGDYVVQLQVTDAFGLTNTDVVIVRDGASNTIPVAVANAANPGQDYFVSLNTATTLQGSATDADGDSLSYSWLLVSKPAGSSAALSNTTTLTPSFTPDVDGDYVIQLFVSDGQSTSIPDVVVLHRTLKNLKPVAVNSTPLTGITARQVTLDGSNSSDPNGDALTFRWALTPPQGSTSTLSSATANMPTFVPDIAGNYLVRLVVSDLVLSSDPISFTIVVTDPPPGSAIALPIGHNLLSISPEGGQYNVGLVYSVRESDFSSTTDVVNLGGVPGFALMVPTQSLVVHPNNGKAYGLMTEVGLYDNGAVIEYDPAAGQVKHYTSIPKDDVGGYSTRNFTSRLLFHPDGKSAYAYSRDGGWGNAGVLIHINFDETSSNYKEVRVIAEVGSPFGAFPGTTKNIRTKLLWSEDNSILAVFPKGAFIVELPAIEFVAPTPISGSSANWGVAWNKKIFSNQVEASGRFLAYERSTTNLVMTQEYRSTFFSLAVRGGGGTVGEEIRNCFTGVGAVQWGATDVYVPCEGTSSEPDRPALFKTNFSVVSGSAVQTFGQLDSSDITGVIPSRFLDKLYLTTYFDQATSILTSTSVQNIYPVVPRPKVVDIEKGTYVYRALIEGDAAVGGERGILFFGDAAAFSEVTDGAGGVTSTQVNDQYVSVFSFDGGIYGRGAILEHDRVTGSSKVHSLGFPNGGYPYGRAEKTSAGYYFAMGNIESSVSGATAFYDDTLGTVTLSPNFPKGIRPAIGLSAHSSNGLLYGLGIDLPTNDYVLYSIEATNGDYTKLIELPRGNEDATPPFEVLVEGDHIWALVDQALYCVTTDGSSQSNYDMTQVGPNNPVRRVTLNAAGDTIFGITTDSVTMGEAAIFSISTATCTNPTLSVNTEVSGASLGVPSTALLLASDGAFYYGTEDGRIMKFDAGTVSQATNATMPNGEKIVGFLTQDSDGDIVGFAEHPGSGDDLMFKYDPVAHTLMTQAVSKDRPIDPIYPGFTEIN